VRERESEREERERESVSECVREKEAVRRELITREHIL
jgi:hypothetical protein